MYKEAKPFIEPDLSNLHRLHREARRREAAERQYPGMAQKLSHIFDHAAVKSYLQALPQKGISQHEDAPGTITPGAIPRGIEITNSITSRKIFVKRLVEAVLDANDTKQDIAAIREEMQDFADYLGLPEGLANQAADHAEREAQKIRMSSTLTLVPGGARPG